MSKPQVDVEGAGGDPRYFNYFSSHSGQARTPMVPESHALRGSNRRLVILKARVHGAVRHSQPIKVYSKIANLQTIVSSSSLDNQRDPMPSPRLLVTTVLLFINMFFGKEFSRC
jgi:hypothetical protein